MWPREVGDLGGARHQADVDPGVNGESVLPAESDRRGEGIEVGRLRGERGGPRFDAVVEIGVAARPNLDEQGVEPAPLAVLVIVSMAVGLTSDARVTHSARTSAPGAAPAAAARTPGRRGQHETHETATRQHLRALTRPPARKPSSSRRRGSMSSPIASRMTPCALRRRDAAFAAGRPVFCITIAAFTFQFARLSSRSASVVVEAGHDAENAAGAVPAASRSSSARRPSGCRRSCRCAPSTRWSAC